MLYSQVALAAGAALLGAQDAHAFFLWWPFSRPVISPHAFTGCIKRTSTWTSIFTSSAPDAATCVANCARLSDMAYWSRTSGVCKCGSTPNALGIFDFSFQPYVSGNEGECGSNYESYMITQYGFLGCANRVDVSNAVTIGSSGRMSSAFESCRPADQVMVFKYGEPRRTRWSAYCFDPTAPPGVDDYDPVTCSGNTYFLYGNAPPEVQRSATARRRGAPDGLPAPWCPQGHTPCQIDEDESLGYECVDVERDGNQCGGCALGVYGSSSTVGGAECGDKADCHAGKCVAHAL
ncbi:hypothetical protein CspeluHIS016_0501000 [Cutaneotrichosporon spelunceum]|uniref:Delayed-type hypersensitivity antigen-related protein n=1 Tax=Cutaneotrichosporon spelunceum TaxID=1672016 RepID=A0AAD3TWL2_9TREE|nr:hypothetical protein CspeluHIS016_0501000 [Cutaneotrichosporon spelunceum]